MNKTLKNRVEQLELASGGGEPTLEEIVLWSLQEPPFDAETQRR